MKIKWQSIETAPKNDYILLSDDDNEDNYDNNNCWVGCYHNGIWIDEEGYELDEVKYWAPYK